MDRQRCSNMTHPPRSPPDFLLGGVLKRPVYGYRTSTSGLVHRRKLLKRLKGTLGYGDQRLYSSKQFAEGSNKYEEFFCYNDRDDVEEQVEVNRDADDEEDSGMVAKEDLGLPFSTMFQDVSINMIDFLSEREMGNIGTAINLKNRLSDVTFQSQLDFPIKHLLTNGILQEKPIKIENLNKVFCSQWLSDRQVAFGTKCNKLMVLDVQTKHMTQIPSLAPSTRSLPPDQQCGIHAVQLNPSRTMLATGGRNPNDVAVYRLPTLDPLCVGEMAHQDWVFALTWLDDQFLVSGSRDTTLALWRVPDIAEESSSFQGPSSSSVTVRAADQLNSDDLSVPSYSFMKAVSVKECKSAQKVRDIVFNRKLQEIACVSLNGYIHVWSADKFVQKYSRKLPFCLENVCMSVHEDYGLYAIGSKSHTTLMDARTVQCVKKIPSKYTGYGIRSTSFYSSILSIGTGQGTVMFYDLRAGKYLDSNINSARSATLKSSSGWTYPDEEVLMDVYRQKYCPAIYTHCVDMSGTRIFAAGGPLPINLCGNYIGLWH